MDPNTAPLDLPALLEHERDLQRLARRLLAQEADVADVVQDTLGGFLRRRPRVARSVSAWLRAALARRIIDHRRTSATRSARERGVARHEALPSVADTLTRIELQQRVASAVLSLDEPYRSVIAAHHFGERSIAEIARDTGRSPGTVRSQLSRAHRTLRERLARELDGGLGALAFLAARRAQVPSLAIALGAGVALLGAALLAWPFAAREARVALHAAGPSGVAAPAAELAAPAPDAGPRRPARAPSTEAGIEREGLPLDLEALTLPELYELVLQARRAYASAAFRPSAALVAANAALLESPRSGLSRVRAGGDPERAERFDRRTGLLGGGAGLAFRSGGHSFHARCDLWHTGDALELGQSSGRRAWLLELGDRALDEVDLEPPVGEDPALAETWRALRAPLAELEGLALEASSANRVPLAAGRTYLLRASEEGDRDHLVAFRVVDVTEADVTLAWRVLEEYPVDDSVSHGFEEREAPWVSDGPAWLMELDEPALERLLDAVQARGVALLLSLPEAAQRLTPAWFEVVPGVSGASRLLIPRGNHANWRPLLFEHDGGTSCSFVAGRPEVRSLFSDTRGRVMTAFSRDSRPILRLGALNEDELRGAFGGTRPRSLSPERAAAWDLILDLDVDLGRANVATPASARAILEAAGVGYPTYVAPGATYLMRAGLDLVEPAAECAVVFTIVLEDDLGYSLLWQRIAARR